VISIASADAILAAPIPGSARPASRENRAAYGHPDGPVPVRPFYGTKVAARYFIKLVFIPIWLIPAGARHAHVGQQGVCWNYLTFLNIAFLRLASVLVRRFFRAGGRQTLTLMGGAPDAVTHHHYHHRSDADAR